MSEYYTYCVVQPVIPKHLINDEDLRFFKEFNLEAEIIGQYAMVYAHRVKMYDALYFNSADLAHAASVEVEPGIYADVDENAIYRRLQEIILRSNGELKWVSIEKSYVCTTMDPYAFGGVAYFITAENIDYVSTHDWLEGKVGEMGISTMDEFNNTDRQNSAIATSDLVESGGRPDQRSLTGTLEIFASFSPDFVGAIEDRTEQGQHDRDAF